VGGTRKEGIKGYGSEIFPIVLNSHLGGRRKRQVGGKSGRRWMRGRCDARGRKGPEKRNGKKPPGEPRGSGAKGRGGIDCGRKRGVGQTCTTQKKERGNGRSENHGELTQGGKFKKNAPHAGEGEWP